MKTRITEYTDDAEMFTAIVEADGIRLNSGVAGGIYVAQRDISNLITFLTELNAALESSGV